ncbi:hypothetical protein CR513_16634, partial [Mucuna pruriens]
MHVSEFDLEIRDKKDADNAVPELNMNLTQCQSETTSRMSNYCTWTHLHHGSQTYAISSLHLSFHQRHPDCIKKRSRVMLSTIYGMTGIFGSATTTKSFVGAFQTPRSTQSSTFVMQQSEATIMDQLGQPERRLPIRLGLRTMPASRNSHESPT